MLFFCFFFFFFLCCSPPFPGRLSLCTWTYQGKKMAQKRLFFLYIYIYNVINCNAERSTLSRSKHLFELYLYMKHHIVAPYREKQPNNSVSQKTECLEVEYKNLDNLKYFLHIVMYYDTSNSM